MHAVATIDWETRSCADIKEVGAWNYSRHPSTEVMCLAYHLPGSDEVKLWSPMLAKYSAQPNDLLEYIKAGGIVEAHNVSFELFVWMNIATKKWGWPALTIKQLRCSAAKAAAHALPRNLEDAVNALGLSEKKDMEGAKLMKQMSKPTRYGTWIEDPASLERLFAYCKQDVRAEMSLSKSLPELSPRELDVFHMDLEINVYGVQLDKAAVHQALKLLEVETEKLNKELQTLTSGEVQKATQRVAMKRWLEAKGLVLEDTQGTTLDETLERKDLHPDARRAVELMRQLGRSSTAKYQAMLAWADTDDWRVRGSLLYHGASTGRWTGKGVQPHNFPRGTIKNMALAWRIILNQPELIDALYGSTHSLLSEALRGAIVASEGMKLFVSDYAGIEARVLMWVADDAEAMDIFRQGKDIYCEMASSIYKRPITKKDEKERFMGKQAILGLGYGMGAPKFQDHCAKLGQEVPLPFAQEVVNTYREKYHRVKSLWYGQEAAAIKATQNPGHTVNAGKTAWRVVGRFLYVRLPSGRMLAYADPKVVSTTTPWGSQKDALSFMAQNPYSHRWQRQTTYGGSLVENIIQAASRDLMAEAMLDFHKSSGYKVVLSVHDELVCEAADGDAHAFGERMAKLPTWAEGCPVTCEAWSGPRYRK